MPNIENLIISSIFLLFPLAAYLIYITYIRNMDKTEENYILDLAIISSLFIMIRYEVMLKEYTPILSSIPLLLSYIKKHLKTSVFTSIILIIFYYNYLNLNIFILIIEYLLYFIIYKLKPNNKVMINGFVSIKSFFYSFYIFSSINPYNNLSNNIFVILTSIILFVTFTYLITFLFKKAEEIMNLNVILQEAQKEQNLYKSLSKLMHELKNPITVCKGYLEMIDKKKKANVNKYIPIISSEIERALNVINDFSSLGKLKSISKEEVDLYLLLEEVKEVLTPLFKKNKDELMLIKEDDELYIELDFIKIKQVLVNIIKNSLEAKRENTKLKVEISVKKLTKSVKITIKDNGIGMSKETLNKIDEIFYTTKPNGNGIGVSLSKEIILLHKGSINYKSTLGKGTTVTIKIPYI